MALRRKKMGTMCARHCRTNLRTLPFKANAGTPHTCIYAGASNSCFTGCILLFIPLNCEAEAAVLGLPRSWVAPRDVVNVPCCGGERPHV